MHRWAARLFAGSNAHTRSHHARPHRRCRHPTCRSTDCPTPPPPNLLLIFFGTTQTKDHIRLHGSVLSYFAVYNDLFSWIASSP